MTEDNAFLATVDRYFDQAAYSHQSSVGFQRQIGSAMAVEADYTYEGERNGFYSHRMNLTYDPVTGVNYPFSDISRKQSPSAPSSTSPGCRATGSC